jgi:hypothetical protein
VASLDKTWADAEEANPLVRVFGAILGINNVHGGLAASIGTAVGQTHLQGEVIVGQTRRDGDDLLDLALQDEGHVEVEQVDVADNVDLKKIEKVILESDRVLATLLFKQEGNNVSKRVLLVGVGQEGAHTGR